MFDMATISFKLRGRFMIFLGILHSKWMWESTTAAADIHGLNNRQRKEK